MLNVFITVDTEVWPRHADRREAGLTLDIERDIYGITELGEFGVRYQMDVLEAHGLKGVFFVEALFASAGGFEQLTRLVQLIQNRGHEVQLHLHTEWLAWLDPSPLPGRTGQNLKNFSLEEQTSLIALGIANLQKCGAKNICAFRAGNYGANLDTLRALARNGIRYDTSHNTCYLDSACDMREAGPLVQPKTIHDVREFPITFFQDWPGHYRHAQLCACSAHEMQHALQQAWKSGWQSFVLVSHSFELIRRPMDHPAHPDNIVIQRFEKLCSFLASNRDKFQTVGFCDMNDSEISQATTFKPLRSAMHRTARRVGEQFMRRIS
jgi:peptidoglycan/xylan/chitin deacetylase (PgdA/CDA1 family)